MQNSVIPTTPPKGMKMKYKNLKMHERAAKHDAKFGMID